MSPPPPSPDPAGEPSMEDILASIRRILNEEDPVPSRPPASPADAAAHAPPEPDPPPAEQEDTDEDLLLLDTSMLVSDPTSGTPTPGTATSGTPAAAPLTPRKTEAIHDDPRADPIRKTPERPVSGGPPTTRPAGGGLLGSASADTAASSIKNLVRTVAAERGAAVHRGGPTIEDVVREELRPLLKTWLDVNLPPLVERLVRAEIERVVGRAVS